MGVPGNQGAVVRVPRAGGRLDVLANGQPFPFALAHDDERVYWTVLPSNHRGAVLSRPLAPPLGPPLPLSTPLPAVCAGARLDLDDVLRNAEACWPRRNPEAGDSHARVRLETDPIVVAAGATTSVGVARRTRPRHRSPSPSKPSPTRARCTSRCCATTDSR